MMSKLGIRLFQIGASSAPMIFVLFGCYLVQEAPHWTLKAAGILVVIVGATAVALMWRFVGEAFRGP